MTPSFHGGHKAAESYEAFTDQKDMDRVLVREQRTQLVAERARSGRRWRSCACTELIQTAMRMTGPKTRREVVDHALRELVRRQEQAKLPELKGRIDWDADLDKMRSGHGDDWA